MPGYYYHIIINSIYVSIFIILEKPGCSVGYPIKQPSEEEEEERVISCRAPSGVIASLNYPSYITLTNQWSIITGNNTYIKIDNFILELTDTSSSEEGCGSSLKISEVSLCSNLP